MTKTKRNFLPALLAVLLLISSHAFAGNYTRTVVDYKMPDVTLVDQNGEDVKLIPYLNSPDKPVIVNFIYATCTTICPVLSASFTNFQKKSGVPLKDVRLVSFTIDPENDTPEIMADYLKRYGGKPGWDFLTGSREDIDAVMKGFDAYVSDKMAHLPVTFFKGPGNSKWVRVYGLLGTADMVTEYNAVKKK